MEKILNTNSRRKSSDSRQHRLFTTFGFFKINIYERLGLYLYLKKMKIRFLCLLLCLITNLCLAQNHEFSVVDKENKRPANYGVNALRSKISLTLSVDTFTKSIKPFNQIPGDSLGNIVFLENAQEALVTVRLRKDSLQYYRYTVIENDTKIITRDAVPGKINFVWNEKSSWPGYLTMDLGINRIENKKITIKIYRLPNAEEVTTLILYNKPIKKVRVLQAILLSNTSVTNRDSTTLKNINDGSVVLLDHGLRYIYVPIDKVDLDFIYRVYIVRKSGTEKVHINFAPVWQYDAADGNPYFLLEAAYFRTPGDYSVYIVPQIGDEENVTGINSSVPQLTFKVLESPKVYSVKDILILVASIVIVTTIIAGLIVHLLRKKSHKKVQAEQKKAERTKEQLDQIRSQLNPHFVFNSLSGIQNLINKNEIKNANAYLSKFARLTRNILNEKELISIEDECHLLDDYLAMVRLRFNFNYELKIDESANLLQVEIPNMLLQPFVENASKHSMSAMAKDGELRIEFKTADRDLILTVGDNGKGFDVNKCHEGFGLKLCRKRIDLLNELYTECPLLLKINSSEFGTLVTITLKNWL